MEGHLRIKSPTTIAILDLGEMLTRFQIAHPKISIELVMLDRSVNPIEEGFDLAIGALPTSYPGVIDEPLCPYPRVVCASPCYLERCDAPQHPRDLVQHDCLTFATTGLNWTFESRRGLINVDVKTKLSANDSQLLLRAAIAGMGIARIANHIAGPSIERGELVALLPDYPVPEFWVKALIPKNRIDAGGAPADRHFEVRFCARDDRPERAPCASEHAAPRHARMRPPRTIKGDPPFRGALLREAE
jgi:DNA-binding transcriptional LysR family regulator